MNETLTTADLDMALAERVSLPCPHCGKSGLTLLFCICQGTGRLWPWREPCHSFCHGGYLPCACGDEHGEKPCGDCAGRLWVPKKPHLEDVLVVAAQVDLALALPLVEGLRLFIIQAMMPPCLLTANSLLEAAKRALLEALPKG